jgi:hypothetical protein
MDDQRTDRAGGGSVTTYTTFERDLIKWFIDHSGHPAVTDQLRSAVLESREYTGAGLYLNLIVPESSRKLIPLSVHSPINGPEISSPVLTNGAGSLLFHKDGVVQFVEVYTYTDELSDDLFKYSFRERNNFPTT